MNNHTLSNTQFFENKAQIKAQIKKIKNNAQAQFSCPYNTVLELISTL